MNHKELDSPEVLDALFKGNIRKANEMMGALYQIHGRVIHGNHLGRSLGYPTANLEILGDKPFLLAYGVYAVKIEVNQQVFNGMVNAGVRPTIEGHTLTVEANLFDFSGDLYGKTLVVHFIDRIRDEKKFDTIDLLVHQLHEDKKEVLRLFS